MSEVVHTFCKDAIPRRTVNKLLKMLVREICRPTSERAAHCKVCGYSTWGRKTPGYPMRQLPLRFGYGIYIMINIMVI
jgi:hypothetical protein